MDTNRLKRFATEARTILMQGVKNRLQTLGFDLKTGKPSGDTTGYGGRCCVDG